MLKLFIGFVLAFGIGAFCRLVDIPIPAPPALVGALLVVTTTVGYALTDRVVHHMETRHRGSDEPANRS